MTKIINIAENLGIKEVGELVWWTIRKPGVGPSQVKEIVDKYSLPSNLKKHIPNPIRPRDAYRRATNFEVTGDIEIYGEKLNYKLFTREVNADLTHILRKLVFELIDQNEERLELIIIADLKYEEENSEKLQVEITKEEFAEDKDIKEVIKQMKQNYQNNLNFYPGNAIRAFVRKMVKELNGYKAMPRGGFYFIPSGHKKELDLIDKIIHEIDSKSSSSYSAQNVLNRQKILGDQGVETARNIYKSHINDTLLKWEKKLNKAENEEEIKEKLRSILEQSDLLIEQIKLLENKIGFDIDYKFIEQFKEEMTKMVEDKIKSSKKEVSEIFTTLKGQLKTA